MNSNRTFIEDFVDVVVTNREDALDDEGYGELEMPKEPSAYEPEPEDYDDDSYADEDVAHD